MANALAQAILDLMGAVDTDAADAQVGKPVRINVLPAFNSALLSVAAGPLGTVLKTLLNPPKLTVKFDVKKDGVSVSLTDDVNWTPPILLGVGQSVLDVALLLKPPVGEDTVATAPFHYEIDVTLIVTIDNDTSPPSKPITIPVDMPALQIPSLLLLGKLADFNVYGRGDDDDDRGTPGSLFVMVRESSPLRDPGAVVEALNHLIGLIPTLESLLHITELPPDPNNPSGPPKDPTDFIGALKFAANCVGTIPTVYFCTGNCSAFDDSDKGFGFEHDASSLLLIGVRKDDSGITNNPQPIPDPQVTPNSGDVATTPGITQVTLYSLNNFQYDGFDLGSVPPRDADHTTFSVNECVIPIPPPPALPQKFVHTGLGFFTYYNFTNPNRGYDTEPSNDMNNDTQSARWGGVDVP